MLSLLSFYPGLNSVSLRKCSSFSSFGSLPSVLFGRCIESLSLPLCHALTDSMLIAALRRPQIDAPVYREPSEEIDWISATIETALVSGHRGPLPVQPMYARVPSEDTGYLGLGNHLIVLDLSCCLGLSDLSIDCICDSTPLLRALCLYGCTQLSPDAIQRLFMSPPSLLNYLDCRHCAVTKAALAHLPSSLTHLLMARCSRVDRLVVSVAEPRGPPNSAMLTQQWSSSMQWRCDLKRSPLRQLNDFLPPRADNQSCLKLIEALPFNTLYSNLLVLHNACNPQLHEVHLIAPHLSMLNLSQCQQLRKLSLCTPSLTSLNLQSCSSLIELEVADEHWVQRLRLSSTPGSTLCHLAQLNVQHCRSLPLTALLQIGQRSGVSMREANFTGLLQLDDVTLSQWVQMCTNQRILALGGCAAISQPLLDALQSKFGSTATIDEEDLTAADAD